MKPSQLKETLKIAFKNNIKILMVGTPGCGKTSIGEQAAAEIDYDFISHIASIDDPTDGKGMPAIINGEKYPEACFLPFNDLKRIIDATRPTVFFLDDFGQASTAVQAAWMHPLQSRMIATHKVSDHVVFCAATNDTSHRAGVVGLIEPIKSRFNTILKVEPSLDDFRSWGLANGIADDVLGYLQNAPADLLNWEPTKDIRNQPCPRNWEHVSDWLKLGAINFSRTDKTKGQDEAQHWSGQNPSAFEILAGCIGEAVAVKLAAVLSYKAEMPSLDYILLNPDKAKVPTTSPGALYAVCSGLARRASVNTLPAIIKYARRMPREFEICCGRDISRVDNGKLVGQREFLEWINKNADVLC